MNNPPTTREPGSQQRKDDKQQKRLGREQSQSDPLVGGQAQRPSHQSSLSDSTVSTVRRLDPHPRPSAKQNTRMIKLSFSNQKIWEGEALFDTGSEENWMSKALSEQLQLPLNPQLEASYVGIQGEDMTSSMSVQGTWHWDHQTHSVTFRIAPNPPILVIFGYPFLKKMKLVDFEKNTKKHAKLVAPVVRNTMKETKEETQKSNAHVAAERERVQRVSRFNQLVAEGWRWDDNERRLWRRKTNGEKEWYAETL